MIQAAFDSASEYKPDRRCAVISSATGILPDGSTEFRTGYENHVAHQRPQIVIERPDSS